MHQDSQEVAVQRCYSTWGTTYYDEYYGSPNAYPPVHREIIRQLLHESEARTLLDAGCGPASMLRDLIHPELEVYGFDLTSEMVAEGDRVLQSAGLLPGRIWQGSVRDRSAFRCPVAPDVFPFDAAICIGVYPHIPEAADREVIENLKASVRPGGLVAIEARNQFFALFTLNRYSYQFLKDELILSEATSLDSDREAIAAALDEMQQYFRMDSPPIRTGKTGEPGYDQILSRTHNPLLLKSQLERAGFCDVELLFYHYHCLPPLFEKENPSLFRRLSLAMENPRDWRGYFMASAFLVVGKRL